jgi:hypothetical protein
LSRYPIPSIGLGNGSGRTLLDIGSNWGRWSLAAASAGYRAIGLDPSLEAALAGTRIARQLDLPVAFVVGDARHLPFRDEAFDVVFSFSVLQHLDKDVVRIVLREMNRVRTSEGTVRVQMANVLGIKQLTNQVRSAVVRLLADVGGYARPPYAFRVRPWTPGEIRRVFAANVGPAVLSPDGFFSLDAQASDVDLLPPYERLVVRVSTGLCAVARRFPLLTRVSDSVMVESIGSRSPRRQ